jgi:hypothetical protein
MPKITYLNRLIVVSINTDNSNIIGLSKRLPRFYDESASYPGPRPVSRAFCFDLLQIDLACRRLLWTRMIICQSSNLSISDLIKRNNIKSLGK